MKDFSRERHWENIYQTKPLHDVSWYQPIPETSLSFFREMNVPKTAKIMDAGGGDSYLVDHLLSLGYQDITVLDISETALTRAKQRLGDKADQVYWIVADVAEFSPVKKYDVWHDRAAFHFLTDEEDINLYVQTVQKSITPRGLLILGTFSEQGPKKCSGIEIKQYSEDGLIARFSSCFSAIKCFKTDHKTPFDTVQNFIFCCFRKST